MGENGRLQEVKINPLIDDEKDKDDENAKEVGSNIAGKLGGGPKSVKSGFSTATTEVAFSNYAYPKKDEDDDEGAIFLKIRGKPGINKKNLALIPMVTFFLFFSGVDAL